MVTRKFHSTDLGSLPLDWACLPVAAIISDISMGPFGSDIKVDNFTSFGVPVLNGYNVKDVVINDVISNFVTQKKAIELKKAVANREDIVITHRGTIGQIAYIPGNSRYKNYVISQSQFRVTFDTKKVLPLFISYYFHSPSGQRDLLEKRGHTGVPALAQPTTNFRKINIPLPPLPEQLAIATALSDTDAYIAALEKLIAKKRHIKKGAMQELLTGKRRLPGFEGEWVEKELIKIVTFYDNLRVPIVESKREVGTTPYYGANGIQGHIKGYTHDGENILIAEDGANDLTNYPVLYVLGRIWVNNHAHVIQGISGRVNTKYLAYALKTVVFVQVLVGGTRAKLNGSVAKTIKIRLPDDSVEQTAIAATLSDMDAELDALTAKLAKARNIKQGMMQELLTGRIRLVDEEH